MKKDPRIHMKLDSQNASFTILAYHLSHCDKVSFSDQSSSVVCHGPTVYN